MGGECCRLRRRPSEEDGNADNADEADFHGFAERDVNGNADNADEADLHGFFRGVFKFSEGLCWAVIFEALRNHNLTTMPISKQELKDLLARNRADRVIDEIKTFSTALSDQYYLDQISLLSGNWISIQQAYFHGRMLETEFHDKKNALNGALLALIGDLPIAEGQTTRKTAFLTTIPPQLPERIFPRLHLMNRIREAFQQKPFVLLHGPSGIGKTRLAEMFFHDYLQEYDYAGWFKVDTGFVQAFYLQANLISIPAIGEAFHTYKNVYQQPDHEVDAACARAFSHYIEQDCPGQKLLVVDGITNFEEILEPHLDLLRLTNTHVLICSHTLPSDSLRVRDAFPYATVVAEPFAEEELKQMLMFYNLDPTLSDVASHPVLKNPLLAGVFLKNCPTDHPEEVRKLIAYLEKVAPGEDYNHRLLTALFRQFDLAPAMKWVMLQYAAMPDIPREPAFVANLVQLKSVSAPVYTNGYNIFKGKYRHDDDPIVHFDRILDWLSARGWLVVDENGEHYLHRAFVPVLQEQCKPKFDYFLEMAENLELKFFLDENDWEEDDSEEGNFHLKRLSEDDYEKHLGALFGLIQEEDSDDYLGLMYKYADLLHMRYEWEKEINLREKAVAILESKDDKESKRLLYAIDKLSTLFYEAGRYGKALDCLSKEMSIRVKFYSLSDPSLAATYNNVGIIYAALGNNEKALKYKKKALEIYKQVLPPLHPDLAASYTNVGSTYGHLGDHEKALEYKEKALRVREQVLPPLHPDLATSYNNIGGTYGDLGDHEKALEYKEKALEICKQVLPPLHTNLARSNNNVGVAYGDLGNHEKSLEYLEKALGIRMQVLPPLHPDLASSYNNIGGTYGNLGNHEKALEYLKIALGIRKQVLPPLHPDLASSYNNIGYSYAKLGRLLEAKDYFEKSQETNFKRGHAFRNWSMYHALQNNTALALENLQKAVDLGFDDLEWITTDDSLDSIRNEQAYLDIVEQLKKKKAAEG